MSEQLNVDESGSPDRQARLEDLKRLRESYANSFRKHAAGSRQKTLFAGMANGVEVALAIMEGKMALGPEP